MTPCLLVSVVFLLHNWLFCLNREFAKLMHWTFNWFLVKHDECVFWISVHLYNFMSVNMTKYKNKFLEEKRMRDHNFKFNPHL